MSVVIWVARQPTSHHPERKVEFKNIDALVKVLREVKIPRGTTGYAEYVLDQRAFCEATGYDYIEIQPFIPKGLGIYDTELQAWYMVNGSYNGGLGSVSEALLAACSEAWDGKLEKPKPVMKMV